MFTRAALCILLAGVGANPAGVEELQRAFERPPDDARILMRWWWFGSAVTKAQLEREMRLMKDGGIGGFEVQPVYPLALDDAASGIRNLPYLSPEFLEALRFTAEKARELGLRMDLTLGSGWPFGGPHIPVAQAAGRLRWERTPVTGSTRRIPLPDLVAGEKLIAAFAGQRELTDIRDGALWLPEGGQRPAEVWFFVSSRTGMIVKRPALGAEGYVLDHYDRAALDNHLSHVGDRLRKALGPIAPYAVFCDSLEVFGSDWTGDFLEEFRRRRGYDLRPHLPALVSQAPDIRYDWGRTLTELLNDRFLKPLHAWAGRSGTRLRVQGYGMPPAALSSYAFADLPEGEGAQWKTLQSTRWASSASHLLGKPVTSSETWTWLHSPSFRATPLDVKAEADRHFLQGINQLIGHGWPYTPDSVEYPGWRFYAAAVFNEKNPWWLVMPDLSLYLQRVSFLMRQGRPANDVALYLPNSDAWAHLAPGRVDLLRGLAERLGPNVVARILEAGYNLDFIDDDTLDHVGRYRIVVLPGVERLPVATVRKLESFARGGAVVATRRLPALAPGFLATEADHRQVREFSGKVPRLVEDENRQLASALAAVLRPDVSLAPPAPDVGFVHRSTESAEIYFLANTGNTRRQTDATFRVEGMEADWWDPLTGRARPVERTGQAIHLDLAPYGSRVIVFSKRPPARVSGVVTGPAPLDISTGWKVTFGTGGKTMQMDRLRSWTDDEDTRWYSGSATYEKDIQAPEGFLRAGVEVRLDFGEGTPLPETRLPSGMQAWLEGPVREAAVVYVNDRRAGSVWCPPYSLDVTGFLRLGQNRLRIVVANVAVNHMAGRRLPDYRLLNLRYGVRFEAQDMDKVQAIPAGLLGPICLRAP